MVHQYLHVGLYGLRKCVVVCGHMVLQYLVVHYHILLKCLFDGDAEIQRGKGKNRFDRERFVVVRDHMVLQYLVVHYHILLKSLFDGDTEIQ